MESVSEQRLYLRKTLYLEVICARWRKLHLITLVLAFIASFTACFNYVVFDSKFHANCPLYAKLSIAKIEEANTSRTYIIVPKEEEKLPPTEWGRDEFCNYLMYVPLVSMLMAVAWILIFTIKRDYR